VKFRLPLFQKWSVYNENQCLVNIKIYHSQTSALDVDNFDKEFTSESPNFTPIDKDLLVSIDQEQFTNFSYTNPMVFEPPSTNNNNSFR